MVYRTHLQPPSRQPDSNRGVELKRRRPLRVERFSLCVAAGPKKNLIALIGLDTTGIPSVRKAAARSALADRYAVTAAAQMYHTARQHAPVAVILCHHIGANVSGLLQGLRRNMGPFADISCVPVDSDYHAGTWGTAVRGAASGLGLTLTTEVDAVTALAKECEARAGGS